jgi:hypothetical protein
LNMIASGLFSYYRFGTVRFIDNPPEAEVVRDVDNGSRSVYSLTITHNIGQVSDGKRIIVTWLSNNLWTCRSCAGGAKSSEACRHRQLGRRSISRSTGYQPTEITTLTKKSRMIWMKVSRKQSFSSRPSQELFNCTDQVRVFR